MIRTAHRHLTWWKAPLVASLLGLPFLVLEYRWFASHHETGAFGGVLYWAGALLPMLWVMLAIGATSGA